MQRNLTANWDSVKQLAAGKEIRVTLNDGRNLRGRFQSATDEALTVAIPNSQEALSRTLVIRIASKGKGHRLRNSLIGLRRSVLRRRLDCRSRR